MSQVAPVMHREPVEIAPRVRPSPRTRVAVLLKTMGRCAICAVKIEGGLFEVDHIIRHADGGADHIDNYQPLCPPCHREKTRTVDTPGAAKTKRMTKCLARDAEEIAAEPKRRKIAAHVDPWGKERRKASHNSREPREGGSSPPSHNNTSGTPNDL